MKCWEVINAPADYNKELHTTSHWQLPLLVSCLWSLLALGQGKTVIHFKSSFLLTSISVLSNCCSLVFTLQSSRFSIIINKVRVIIELLRILPPNHWSRLGIFKEQGEQQESHNDADHGEMLDWYWQYKYRHRCMAGSFQLCQSMKIAGVNADMIQDDWKLRLGCCLVDF